MSWSVEREGLIQGIEWALLLLSLALITTIELYSANVVVGLFLLVASFSLRAIRTRRLLPRTGIEIPGLIFVASAFVSAWIAYDRPIALLQLTRILAAFTLFYAIADRPDSRQGYRVERLVASGLVMAAALLAIYWPAKHDFQIEPVKFFLLSQVGLWINSHIPVPPGPTIHSNVAAGTLALSVPFAVCLAWEFWRLGRRSLSLLFAFLGLVILGGILITGSRGALLGLAVACVLVLLALIQRRWFVTPLHKGVFWSFIGLRALAMVTILLTTGNLDRLIGSIPGPTGTLTSRLSLWAKGTTLIRDYFFTGVGLVAFNMVYSLHGLLSHLPYLAHIHNFYMEVWIEQGIIGFLSFIACGFVVASWAYRALDIRLAPSAPGASSRNIDSSTALGWAGLASIVVVAIHGLVDVVFYIERTLPLLGLVTGFAYLATTFHPASALVDSKVASTAQRPKLRWILASVFGVLVLLIAGIYHRSALSAWYANLGTIAQAQIEIPAYLSDDWQNTTIDKVRQVGDLGPVLSAYQRALSTDPTNLTALQRMADIELSRGQYEQALQHISEAWQAGRRDDVTRLLYGDALVANGLPEQAAQVVRGIVDAEVRLMYQAVYRYFFSGDYPRAGDAWRTVLLLNPQSSQARKGLVDVQRRLNNPSGSSVVPDGTLPPNP